MKLSLNGISVGFMQVSADLTYAFECVFNCVHVIMRTGLKCKSTCGWSECMFLSANICKQFKVSMSLLKMQTPLVKNTCTKCTNI